MSTENIPNFEDPVRSVLGADRREFLRLTSSGVSALALSSLINKGSAADLSSGPPRLHHEQKAKSVILCYMSGGFSHVDSFDPKPKLREMDGKPLPMAIERTQFDSVGNIMGSPWEDR